MASMKPPRRRFFGARGLAEMCACNAREIPARGPAAKRYRLTEAGEAWLREHPLPPLPSETPKLPGRYLSEQQRREIAERWARLVL